MTAAIASRMTNHRFAFLIVLVTACGTDAEPGPDAGVRPPPIEPAGKFAVRSTITLATPPAAVTDVLAELATATDGPDDPSRYLIDLVTERIPDGYIKTFALEAAPFLAAYVNARISSAAPRFVPGVRALVDGLGRTARRIVTIEHLQIDAAGRVDRTIAGLRFDAIDVYFADVGLDDVTVTTNAIVAGDGLVIAAHTAGVAYGPLIRLGLDRAVIPAVVPGAHDLAGALHGLVDCPRLGALIAEAVGIGPARLYADACTVGLTRAAARIYDQLPALDALPIALEVTGAARAIDRDRNGTMDSFTDGRWVGTFDRAPLGAAIFEGTAR